MKNFCEGFLWGIVAGACVGAVVVAKNKKLSNKLRQGIDITEDKLKEAKQVIQENLKNDEDSRDFNEMKSNNNFSKKNKND